MKVSHDDLISSAATADDMQRNYLRQRGWTYDSHYPDCYWRWSKKIEWKKRTRTLCLNTADAISIQKSLDYYAEEEAAHAEAAEDAGS